VGWIAGVRGNLVAVDAAPLIYFAEEHPHYLPIVEPFFEALDRGELQAVTSTVALLEVLVLPLRQGDTHLAQAYRTILLNSRSLTSVPVSAAIAEQAAQLRAQFTIRTPDAIHVATALYAGAPVFLTNDTRLPVIPGITILALDDLAVQP
jgi:predicted nucleic acid-binding protein